MLWHLVRRAQGCFWAAPFASDSPLHKDWTQNNSSAEAEKLILECSAL